MARATELVAAPGAAAPAGLLEQRDRRDLDPALDALDHVVDGQRRDRRGGHRLHLHARPGGDARLRGERHRPGGGVDRRVDVDVVEAERVAERDEVPGALGGEHAGDARRAEDVALRRVAGRHLRGGLRAHPDDGASDRAAVARRLVADGDHASGALRVEVGELAHAGAAEVCAAAMMSRTACVSPARSSAIGSGSPLTMPSKNSLRSWYVGSVPFAHPRTSLSITARVAYSSPNSSATSAFMRLASAGDAPAVEIAMASGPVRRIAGRMKLHSGGTSTTLTSIARFSASSYTRMLTSVSFVDATTMNVPSRSAGSYSRCSQRIEPSRARSWSSGTASGATSVTSPSQASRPSTFSRPISPPPTTRHLRAESFRQAM